MKDVAKNASAIRYFMAIPRPRSMPILGHEPRLPGDRFVTAQPKESPAAIAKLAIKSCSEQMIARFRMGRSALAAGGAILMVARRRAAGLCRPREPCASRFARLGRLQYPSRGPR